MASEKLIVTAAQIEAIHRIAEPFEGSRDNDSNYEDEWSIEATNLEGTVHFVRVGVSDPGPGGLINEHGQVLVLDFDS